VENPSAVKLRILVVDDAMPILKVVSKMLTVMGHAVTTAENGRIGLNHMMQSLANPGGHTLDLVLTDLQMPVMDGFECVRKYRVAEEKTHRAHLSSLAQDVLSHNPVESRGEMSLRAATVSAFGAASTYAGKCMGGDGKWSHRLLIIGASASCDDAIRQCALDAGIDFFVCKPYTYKDLAPILDREGFLTPSQQLDGSSVRNTRLIPSSKANKNGHEHPFLSSLNSSTVGTAESSVFSSRQCS
jgi:CheY-like chemotaxis protein